MTDKLQFLVLYIHLYSHKLQLQKQEIKITKEKERHINDMRYINPRFTYLLTYLLTCQMHTNYAQRKRKIT